MTLLVARVLFYPTLGWNILLSRWSRRRRWYDRIDDHVILGALPFACQVPPLRRLGVGAVLNMCAETRGPTHAWEQEGVVQLNLPTIDFTPPTLQVIDLALSFIREQTFHGRTVYVHCKAGRGRSATIVLCWLITRLGLSAEQAQAHLLKIRPHVNRNLYQLGVVREFERREGPLPPTV